MCCSELAGRWLFGDKLYDEGKIYLLNNAIDLHKFEYNEKIREEVRKELNIDEETFVMGHIGRFVTVKNHEFLLDVFHEIYKENKNSILVLAGQGPLKEKIEQKAKEMNLDKAVQFLGQRSDANRLYQAMDVFVLPSLYEGLPVVGVEAQAAGLLYVLSDDMTKETKVLETTTFLSLNEGAKKWADTIDNATKQFERKNMLNEMAQKGFDIQKEVKKLEEIYRKLDTNDRKGK